MAHRQKMPSVQETVAGSLAGAEHGPRWVADSTKMKIEPLKVELFAAKTPQSCKPRPWRCHAMLIDIPWAYLGLLQCHWGARQGGVAREADRPGSHLWQSTASAPQPR